MLDAAERKSQVVRYGVLGVVLALLSFSLAWSFFRGDPGRVKPVTRKVSDFLVTWRCLSCGNEFEDAADRGPRECPKCSKKEAFVRFRYTCREHGEYLVAFNYNDKLKPDQVKVGDGPWVPYFDATASKFGFTCPKCGRMLDVAEAPRAALKPGDVEEPEVPPDQQQPAGAPEAGG